MSKDYERLQASFISLREEYIELENKINDVLKVCKPHTDFMWSAKIISILLGCDFRDAKNQVDNFFSEEYNDETN